MLVTFSKGTWWKHENCHHNHFILFCHVFISCHLVIASWMVSKRHIEGSHLTTFGREQFDCLEHLAEVKLQNVFVQTVFVFVLVTTQFDCFEHLAEVKSQTRDLGSPEGKLSIVKLDVRHLELGLGLELELGLALVVDKQGVALV